MSKNKNSIAVKLSRVPCASMHLMRRPKCSTHIVLLHLVSGANRGASLRAARKLKKKTQAKGQTAHRASSQSASPITITDPCRPRAHGPASPSRTPLPTSIRRGSFIPPPTLFHCYSSLLSLSETAHRADRAIHRLSAIRIRATGDHPQLGYAPDSTRELNTYAYSPHYRTFGTRMAYVRFPRSSSDASHLPPEHILAPRFAPAGYPPTDDLSSAFQAALEGAKRRMTALSPRPS